MEKQRRYWLGLAGAAAATGWLPAADAAESARAPIRALAFDAFPVFDPRPLQVLAQSLFPAQGAALMDAWRLRLFEYQWLRALGGRYVDFMQTVRDSLDFAAAQLAIPLGAGQRERLVDSWSKLGVWPDATPALKALRDAGHRLIFLSNMTEPMLRRSATSAGVDGLFEAYVSTDRIRSYKPDPRAYQLGLEVLGLRREEILFVAFAGWDVAGAKWFGYPTFWLNRQGAAQERLDVVPDAEGSDLAALVAYVSQRKAG